MVLVPSSRQVLRCLGAVLVAASAANVSFAQTSVAVTAGDTNIGELDRNVGTFIFRRSKSDINAAHVVLYTLSGTAALNDDYTRSTTTLRIPAGQSTALLTITPREDNAVEGTETVIATIIDTKNQSADPNNSSAQLAISDDPVQVSLRNDDGAADEANGDSGQVVFNRSSAGNLGQPLTIRYSLTGTATRDIDYVTDPADSGSITIGSGSRLAKLVITPHSDNAVEGTETVEIAIVGSNAYLIESIGRNAQISIADDPVQVSVSAAVASSSEDSTTPARIRFQRSSNGDLSSVLRVSFRVSGTATPNSDFTPGNGSLTRIDIGAGDTFADYEIAPLPDNESEASETVIVTLSSSSRYVVDANAQAAQATIIDSSRGNTIFADQFGDQK